MDIFDIQGLIDNSATIYTKIEILPKVAGEEIITLTNEDSIKEWVYSDLRNVEKEGFIGQFVARTLDGELQDIADDFNIEDREIVLYLGIFSNHTAELVTQNNNEIITQSNEGIITEQGTDILTYYKLGNFFVEKPESDEVRDNTKFQAMDYTILFNTPFNADFKDSEYTKSFNEKIEDEETVTALWLVQYTCKQVGVVLGTTTFRNSNFVISSNQFDSGYTCRDVIKSIAKLAITWARIGWDNKLYLDFDKQTTIEDYNVITNDNYYELTTQKDVYGEVNRILMGSSIVIGNGAYVEDTQSIENNGLTELDIYDNPILYTQELREQAITSASSMLGLMYQPIEVETTGHPWLLGNELITVVDMEDNHLNTYALDRILTYNGHIRSKISSMAKTETESTYSYQGVENNDLEIKRSKVELDRQNQTLTSVMERTTTNESQISNINQNINGLNVNVTSMSGDISNLQGNVSSINSSITDINTSISDISDDISNLSTDLNGLAVDINDFIDNEYVQTIQELQDQIDGVIEFWTGDNIPTLNNAPASSWTTEALKQEHIGDVYIVLSGTAQGANYRFVNDNGTWKWLEISDSQIGAVRELAQQALNQANANALDIIDLQRTDVQFQADLDGITASYSTLNTRVNELGEGYDAITVAERTAVGNPVLIEDCGEYLIKNLTIYGNLYGENILPAGYTQLTYIENDEPAVIDTLGWMNKIEIEFALTDLTSTQEFGINNQTVMFQFDPNIGLRFENGYNNYTILIDIQDMDTNKHKYVIDTKNKTAQIDDGEIISLAGSSNTNTLPFHLFRKYSYSDNHPYYTYMKLYSCKFYQNDVLVRNFIPCKNINNKKGLYDLETKYFYTNRLESDFIAGDEILHPTYTQPDNMLYVTGEYTLDISSNNLFHIDNTSTAFSDVIVRAEDEIFEYNGTSSSASTSHSFDETTTQLSAGIYTISYTIDGESTNENIPNIYLYGTSQIVSFSGTNKHGSKNFVLNETTDCYIRLSIQANTTYTNYQIKIQIEKGNEATSYSKFVPSTSYTYNLSNLELYGIQNYKDNIYYNITDEQWYYFNCITRKNLGNVIQTTGTSDDNNIVMKTYETNTSGFGTTFKILSKDLPCLCTHFKWGGTASSDTEALSKGIGMYTNYKNINGNPCPILYVVIPKTIASSASSFKTWCQNNNVDIWYVQEDFITEELSDNNLISDLDNIRNNAKLYNTHMMIQDTPIDTSTATGDIGINYLTDTVFNGIYASRSELKITQNSISTTVSETVNAVVENIDNRVTDVANTLEQNSKDLSNSINTLNESLGEYAKQSTLVTVTNSVEEIQTALNEQILVTQQIKEDGVDKVTTTTGFTFDKDGLTIAKTGANTKTLVDEDGMTVYSTTGSEESVLLNVDSQGVQTENLHVRTYTQIGDHSRLQDYEDGTAIFYIE